MTMIPVIPQREEPWWDTDDDEDPGDIDASSWILYGMDLGG